MVDPLSRRGFLELGAAAAVAGVGAFAASASAAGTPAHRVGREPWVEADLRTLQRHLAPR